MITVVVLDADIFTCFVNWDDQESCNDWVKTFDITGKEPGEVAGYVMEWVKKNL